MASTARPLVVGIFDNEAQAKQARNELRHAGFSRNQIRIAMATERSTAGQISNALIQSGIPPTEADYYEQEFQSGHIIEIVRTDNRVQDALDTLRSHGAHHVRASSLAVDHESTHPERATRLPLHKEQLHIQKQWVETGYVVIHKRVIAEERTIKVTVNREEVQIEHYDRADQLPSNLSHMGLGQPIKLEVGQTINVLAREEQIVIEKQPVIIEEIIIGKRAIQETQHISETIRREEPRIERVGDVIIRETTAEDTSHL